MTLATQVTIRTGHDTPEETALIAGIWRRAWAQSDSPHLPPIAHWRERVRSEFGAPATLLVMERDQQPLAFMLLHLRRSYLSQLFIDVHVQGQGLGGALVAEACRRLPGGWYLHVATTNLHAQRFYRRHGLSPGAIDRHPVSGRERLVYRWASD